jgi:hypothetical protein
MNNRQPLLIIGLSLAFSGVTLMYISEKLGQGGGGSLAGMVGIFIALIGGLVTGTFGILYFKDKYKK